MYKYIPYKFLIINMLQFTIIIMSILSGAEVDLFVPSFPELSQIFNLTAFQVELTLGINLAMNAISCLFVGNLGDKYGKKPVLLYTLVIFIIGSIFCTFAQSYWQLLLGRALQGVGISGAAVLPFTIIAEVFSVKKQQELMGFNTGVVVMAMSLAPVVGSYIALFLGWRGNFAFLLLLGIISLLLCYFFVPESKANHKIKISLKSYLEVLQTSKSLYYILTFISLVVPYWVFIGMAPILYMESLGVTLEIFGLYQGSMSVLFAAINFVSNTIKSKFGEKKVMLMSLFTIAIFILCTLIISVMDVRNPLIITLDMFILSIAVVFPVNILYPMALASMENAQGRISALMSGGRWFMAAIGVQTASYCYNGSFFSLGIVMIVPLVIMFWLFHKLSKIENLYGIKV